MTCPRKLTVCAHSGRETANVATRKKNNFIFNIGSAAIGAAAGRIVWVLIDDDPDWAKVTVWPIFPIVQAASSSAPDGHEIEQPGPRTGHLRRAPQSWPSKTALSRKKDSGMEIAMTDFSSVGMATL